MKSVLNILFRAAGCVALLLFTLSVYGTTAYVGSMQHDEAGVYAYTQHEIVAASANSLYLDTQCCRSASATAQPLRRTVSTASGFGSLCAVRSDATLVHSSAYPSTTCSSAWVRPSVQYHIYALHRLRI